MNVATVPMAMLRVPYAIVRMPLQLTENLLMSRLPEDASLRLVFERTLGVSGGQTQKGR